ncbi:MAG: penicillin-binding protein 2 [Chromatiales bacterium]|jgi:penicillin-binding protein 2|nr:penicillin-binding protein 2 [Chromatiales bacterium]MDX9767977.1 penicillin-binding protein 2 [Ectothiorhodospiraceae bacterium]
MPSRQAIKDAQLEQGLFLRRLLFVGLLILLAFAAVIARLIDLQIVNHEHFTTLSQNNRVRLEALPPPRGLIYDRNGVLLAENRPTYQLEVVPEQVRHLDETLAQLGELVAIEPSDVDRFRRMIRRRAPFQAIPLRLNLSDEEVGILAVNRHRFPGVDIQARLGRHYPLDAATAHVLGYVGRIDERELARIDARNYNGTSHIGKIGIERHFEDELHGDIGYRQVEVNAQGRVLRVLDRQPPQSGRDLILGLDIGLQLAAQEALGGRSGAIVAIEPQTGEVLALVSMPAFDPNLFVNGIPASTYSALRQDRAQPLFNRALTGQYPPGSTIKPVIGLAGLEYGVTTASRTMFAAGYYTLPNDTRRYRDWRRQGHGLVDLDLAITQSSDVYFYDLAYRLGIDRMSEFLDRFGMGARTGIDTTGEAPGILPSREWKRRTQNMPWYPGETIIAGIGQGYMLTTPLQLASITATLAMRGERVRPRLLRAMVDSGDETPQWTEREPLPPVSVRDPMFWDQVLEPMVHVMHEKNGTAYGSTGRDAAYMIAGKTGTAQVFGLGEGEYEEDEVAAHLRDHALFIGYAPAESPRIAVAVVVENGGSGGRVAAPVARKVMDHYLLNGHPDDSPNGRPGGAM